MRTLLALALLLTASTLVAQSIDPATIGVVSPGTAYYRVYVDDEEVSKHTTPHKAWESAVRHLATNPGSDVRYTLNAQWVVTADLVTAPPDPVDPDPVDPDPPVDPTDPLSRPVITESDIQFVGGFGVAGYAVNGMESRFTGGGFTHRITDDGAIEFLATGHIGVPTIYSFPMLDPSTGDKDAWVLSPTSDVTEAPGSTRPFQLIRSINNQLSQHAIYFSDRDSLLYTTGRHSYNANSINYPSLAAMLPSGASIGPWRTDGAHNQWVGGGLDDIPRWFADAYLDGMDLAMGGGGRMSGQGASQGPALAAVQRPDATTGDTIQAKTLLHFPWGSEHRERRAPDYIRTTDHWLGLVPNEDHGWFTAMDHVRDFVWIDLLDKQGVMFVPHMGHGEIAYISGAVTASEGQSSSFYVYSMADLARVAKGEAEPHEINATSYWPAGFRNQVMGIAMIERRIYLLVKNGGPVVNGYRYHGVYVFEVTE